MPDEFKMPPVQVGDIVWWFADSRPGAAPTMAFVTAVTHTSLDLACLHPGYIQVLPRTGVMHVDDPRVRQHPDERGAWMPRPLTPIEQETPKPTASAKKSAA